MQEISTKDAAEMLAIYNLSFARPWREDDMEQLLSSPATSGFIVENCGFILYQKVEGEAEIITIAVRPEERRKGFASLLLERLQEQSSSIFLEVNITNQAAVNFYKKHGFTEIGLRKKYYDDKDDALVMRYDS